MPTTTRSMADTTTGAAAAATAGATPAETLPTTTSTNEVRIETDVIGLEDLPLELIAAITDYVHAFPHLAAMMLGSRRLRDGVSLSRQWRIAEEVMRGAADVEERRKILFDRQQIILHASRLGNTRLLRYVQLTREEAYRLCLPVACVYGHIEFVRYLMTEFDIKDTLLCQGLLPRGLHWGGCDDVLDRDFSALAEEVPVFEYSPFDIACACPSGLPLVKYFHEECGILEVTASAIDCAATEDRLDTLKYLHSAFGLTVDNTCTSDSFAFHSACGNGRLAVVEYLHTSVGLTADNIRANDIGALLASCRCGHLPVVEYLHTAFGLTADDARDDSNIALRSACLRGHLPVVEYLHTAFGLTAEDARATRAYGDARNALAEAVTHGHMPVVQYLHTGFGLTGTDLLRAARNMSDEQLMMFDDVIFGGCVWAIGRTDA